MNTMDVTASTIIPTTSLSVAQLAAIDRIMNWHNQPDRTPIFRLFGLAGTGKTMLAREIALRIDGPVEFVTFTGKAAMVLRQAGCPDAKTIHSLIYQPFRRPDGSIRFRWNPGSPAAMASLIVVDECSMVDEPLARDLLRFNVPLLVLGDPGQLPPVADGGGFLTRAAPDVLLTEVHRQARGNAILTIAQCVRHGLPLRPASYGSSRVVLGADFDDAMLLWADVVLVGDNDLRVGVNQLIRTLKGFSGDIPEVGETLICTRNDHGRGIANGERFTVVSVDAVSATDFTLTVRSIDVPADPLSVSILKSAFPGSPKSAARPWSNKHQGFDFGYAMTTHKAQGSQWNKVVVMNTRKMVDKLMRGEGRTWLYTAVTRAIDSVIIVQL